MSKVTTFFKVTKNSREMSFGSKTDPRNFNYVDFGQVSNSEMVKVKTNLSKQMHDSYLLELERYENKSVVFSAEELKLTNQQILTWEDYWVDGSNNLIDPHIKKLNLQKNDLVHVNFNLPRLTMTDLVLEGNLGMKTVILSDCPSLSKLNLSNCPSLEVINLGNNKSIKALLARNCNMSSVTQERLLRDFRPTLTSSSNVKFSMFRKTYETLLDMRGSEIDWGNRLVASKIRLLICNNWLVLWDNTPPVSVIPPHMYSFFTNSLEDSLIKDYYSN